MKKIVSAFVKGYRSTSNMSMKALWNNHIKHKNIFSHISTINKDVLPKNVKYNITVK